MTGLKSFFSKSALLLLTVSLLFGQGCRKNPVTGKKELTLVSESSEVRLGTQHYLSMQQAQGGDLVTNPKVVDYIRDVGNKLAAVSDRPNLPYEFTVLNNSIPNAWALPGGKIAVNRGLLVELESEAELAAVLAHEIVHAAARHGAKSIERNILWQTGLAGFGSVVKDKKHSELLIGGASVAVGLITTKHSRDAESEADQYAITYMIRAGYDPRAAISLQEKFVKLANEKNPSWFEGLFATHPPSQERVKANRKLIASIDTALPDHTGAAKYQKKIAPIKENKEAYEKLDHAYQAYVEGNFRKATTLAEEGLALMPNEAHFWGLIGKVKANAKNFDGAIEALDRAITLNNSYFDFYLQRGLSKVKIRDREGAKKDLEDSIQLLPTAQAHHLLGHLEIHDQEQQAAIDHFRKAGELETPLGLKSREWLAKLEVPKNPHKYLKITATLDKVGFLVLHATNKGPIAVHNVAIVVDIRDNEGVVRATEFVRFPETIQVGQRTRMATGIGPFDKDTNLQGNISAEIASINTKSTSKYR